MKRASLLTLTLIGAFSAIQAAWAVDYPLPPTGSRLVGQNQTYTVQEGDKNLQAIARRFDTAAMLILEANNTIAPVPKPGTTITIPSQLLLPDAPRQGIIVNLAELRLYYYPPGENIVQVYPLAFWAHCRKANPVLRKWWCLALRIGDIEKACRGMCACVSAQRECLFLSR